MADYLTEQEQIDLLKRWFKQYALVIFLGIVTAFLLIYSWRYWQGLQEQKLGTASSLYDEMLTLTAQNNPSEAKSRAIKLFDKYTKTPYGEIAALYLAREAVAKQNFIEAKQYLSSISQDARTSSMRQIAKIRLARILITENKAKEALSALNKIDDDAFLPLVLEIRGDAFLHLKETENAKKAYRDAVESLPNAEVVRPLLLIKLENLASKDQSG